MKLDLKAPKGKFRVIEVDTLEATGFYNDDPRGENCFYFVSDHRFLTRAKMVARRKTSGRFNRQVHTENGTCIYASLSRGEGYDPRRVKSN